MIEAGTVLALYLVYLAIPRHWRSRINGWFWVFAFAGALVFATYSLFATGTLPEPATGARASPTRLAWLR